MVLRTSDVRGTIERVFMREDVLDACRKQDLGTVIEILLRHGVTQGWIASRTGFGQGRLSQYMHHLITPRASSTFEKFANGIGIPPAGRQALGLAPTAAEDMGIAGHVPDTGSADVGLSYPDTPADAAENVMQLWRTDLTDAPPRVGLQPAAWNDASLRWLIDPAPSKPPWQGWRCRRAPVPTALPGVRTGPSSANAGGQKLCS